MADEISFLNTLPILLIKSFAKYVWHLCYQFHKLWEINSMQKVWSVLTEATNVTKPAVHTASDGGGEGAISLFVIMSK